MSQGRQLKTRLHICALICAANGIHPFCLETVGLAHANVTYCVLKPDRHTAAKYRCALNKAPASKLVFEVVLRGRDLNVVVEFHHLRAASGLWLISVLWERRHLRSDNVGHFFERSVGLHHGRNECGREGASLVSLFRLGSFRGTVEYVCVQRVL